MGTEDLPYMYYDIPDSYSRSLQAAQVYLKGTDDHPQRHLP